MKVATFDFYDTSVEWNNNLYSLGNLLRIVLVGNIVRNTLKIKVLDYFCYNSNLNELVS